MEQVIYQQVKQLQQQMRMHKNTLNNFLIYLVASVLFLSGCDIQKEHHANISEDIVSPIQQASFARIYLRQFLMKLCIIKLRVESYLH